MTSQEADRSPTRNDTVRDIPPLWKPAVLLIAAGFVVLELEAKNL